MDYKTIYVRVYATITAHDLLVGTTWVQQIVHEILSIDHPHANDGRTIEDRFPYLEFVYPGLKEINKMHEQRLLKSHLQFDALPAQVKNGHGKVQTDLNFSLQCINFASYFA